MTNYIHVEVSEVEGELIDQEQTRKFKFNPDTLDIVLEMLEHLEREG
ncbi:hypothetical protein LCGC14_2669360 [marine sediment metagenome]|uniref:Uncharacterized protein n=1 Tax=marine sediment metagenome TaxID=412755 RepID=A0A0F9CGD7_9ZZZZ